MKRICSFKEALREVSDGATLMVGGFGLCGIPETLVRSLVEKNVRNLTIISNNCGIDDWGLGLLLKNRQIKKLIGSYVGENKEFERQVIAGELEVELLPQGTLAEKIRAGGAGVRSFFTPAVGRAKGKEIRTYNGIEYWLEDALIADFSIVRAWKGDLLGNLVYHKTARNFNPLMAAAGRVTIAEIETFVEMGELREEQIHTPSLYVQTIVEGRPERRRKPVQIR